MRGRIPEQSPRPVLALDDAAELDAAEWDAADLALDAAE